MIYVSTEGYKYLVEKDILKEDEPEASEETQKILEDFKKDMKKGSSDNRPLLERLQDL